MIFISALLLLLIVAILDGALAFVDNALLSLVPMSLNAEDYLDSLIGISGFGDVFDLFFAVGISLIILKFLKKGFEVYVLWSDGDAEANPLTLVTNFVKAIAIAISFPTIYAWFAQVVDDLANEVIDVIGLSLNEDMATLLTGISSAGLFTAIVALIFFITFFILYIQFLMKGLELLILRIGMPLACSGLMDADKGIFKAYSGKFVQSLAAIVVQLALAKLGVALMLNTHIFWGLASMILAVKTPRFLQEFLLTTGGGHGLTTVYQTVQLGRAAKAIVTK